MSRWKYAVLSTYVNPRLRRFSKSAMFVAIGFMAHIISYSRHEINAPGHARFVITPSRRRCTSTEGLREGQQGQAQTQPGVASNPAGEALELDSQLRRRSGRVCGVKEKNNSDTKRTFRARRTAVSMFSVVKTKSVRCGMFSHKPSFDEHEKRTHCERNANAKTR